ncbi:MAG: glycosyltransferase family 4 protein, partial [Kiritimatiellae bacterium]|nr:glycosyltransferase family 4 protein [Kiritimatiellia bacterium]
QKSYFIEQGIPEERIAVILHGMDSSYFHPAEQRTGEPGEPLRGFMIGVTERDHAFLAEVCRALPPGLLNLSVATSRDQQVHYQGLSGVTLLPRLDDPGLLRTYQQSDLLLMPVMDCTANNSILESMACGTPVMTNRIGGVPEYVPDECNVVMPDKTLTDWVDRIQKLATNRDQLEAMRPRVRAWAQSLDWHTVAGHYISFYEELKGMR